MQLRHSNGEQVSTPIRGSYVSAGVPVEILDHARKIAITLMRGFADKPTYVLGITSAVRGEGKTTISLALAEVMATDFGLNLVLLDTHAESSWSRVDAEIGKSPGLSDWLSGEASLQEALVSVHDKYARLPFGGQAISSRDLLQHLIRNEALAQLRQRFSLILVDLPDLANPSGSALANQCDGVVLVVRAGDTPVDVIREYLPELQNLTIHGTVLNQHTSAIPLAIRRTFS